MITPIEDIKIHIAILNDELGIVKNDLKWVKKLMLYLAVLLTSIVIKSYM